MLSPLGSKPRASDFNVLHAYYCKSQPFRSLCNHALLILRLRILWNQQSMTTQVKGLDFQHPGELAQAGACREVKSEALGSLPSGGNILLLDFFSFLIILQNLQNLKPIQKNSNTRINPCVSWVSVSADSGVNCNSINLHTQPMLQERHHHSVLIEII